MLNNGVQFQVTLTMCLLSAFLPSSSASSHQWIILFAATQYYKLSLITILCSCKVELNSQFIYSGIGKKQSIQHLLGARFYSCKKHLFPLTQTTSEVKLLDDTQLVSVSKLEIKIILRNFKLCVLSIISHSFSCDLNGQINLQMLYYDLLIVANNFNQKETL